MRPVVLPIPDVVELPDPNTYHASEIRLHTTRRGAYEVVRLRRAVAYLPDAAWVLRETYDASGRPLTLSYEMRLKFCEALSAPPDKPPFGHGIAASSMRVSVFLFSVGKVVGAMEKIAIEHEVRVWIDEEERIW